ncbi:MAG: ABC transporter substrate-binding protein [Deltaproteobacteria bacterium]|nr:ABC transporter substrate-binding protein [Deltaproteobacteria bacterium]
MMRRLWKAAITAGLTGIWLGTAFAAPAIRLGAHGPQTGSLAQHGIEQMKGIRLGAEEFEKKHKVKVELFVYDDESSPLKAVAAVEKLAGVEKVDGIVGGYGSNLVGPASEAAERYDTPYLTTGGVDTKLSAKRFKNFFRLNYMTGLAAAQSGTIRNLFKAKTMGIVYNSLSGTTEIAEMVRDELVKAGIAVPVFEKFEKGTTNYKPILLKVRDAGCDVLLVEGYFSDYVGTIKDAKILNLPVKAYVGAWGIGTPEFTRELGPMGEYVYGTSVWEMGTAPKAAKKEEAEIVAAYKARYNEEPSYLAMLGYLSTKYMLDAIGKGGAQAGSYRAEQTRQRLRGLDVVGPLGRVAFDEKGDPKHFTAVLFQIQQGNRVVVYPRERATGSVRYPGVPWGGK